jgi:prepilin peptidase CpaA
MDLVLNLTLSLILIGAAFFDIKERRIPNWIILFSLIAGLVLGALQSSSQLIFNVAGFFAGIMALMIPFAFGWMGAGDVKLFGAVGAVVGYKALPRIFFYSCIAAGTIALVALTLARARQMSFKYFWTDCKFMILTLGASLPQSTPLGSGGYSVPWGAAIGAGTIMAYYFDPTGTWAGF